MKKLISLCAFIMLFAVSSLFAQEKPSEPQEKNLISSPIPIGRLYWGRVFINEHNEVDILCICVAPYDESCLTRHSAMALANQSNSKETSLSNINLSNAETTLINSDKNKRVYKLKIKPVK